MPNSHRICGSAAFVSLAVAAATLAGCATPPSPEDCARARQAVALAEIGLTNACTHESKACDTAGLVLKVANQTVTLLCPAPP